jgi:acetyl esterase/lipase
MEDRPLVVSGDSAGGGLAASLGVLSQTDPSLWMDGLILLSPWLDLTVSAPSYSANAADDPLFSEQVARNAADLYLQGVNPRHPLASPLLARIESFPSTLINVGAREVLADDAVLFHEKLRSAGVQSELLTIGGMEHTAVVRSANLLGAAESFDRIAHFISRVIAAP